jgi:hypothetical protein
LQYRYHPSLIGCQLSANGRRSSTLSDHAPVSKHKPFRWGLQQLARRGQNLVADVNSGGAARGADGYRRPAPADAKIKAGRIRIGSANAARAATASATVATMTSFPSRAAGNQILLRPQAAQPLSGKVHAAPDARDGEGARIPPPGSTLGLTMPPTAIGSWQQGRIRRPYGYHSPEDARA